MRLKLKLKVSHQAGVLLVSRMGPFVIELLLIGGQREENGLKKSNTMLLQKIVWGKWIQEENVCHME